MGVQRTSFEKLQRDRAKKAKALAKLERRHGTTVAQPAGDAAEDPGATGTSRLTPDDATSATDLLRMIEEKRESGILSANAHVSGTLDDPQGHGTFDLTKARRQKSGVSRVTSVACWIWTHQPICQRDGLPERFPQHPQGFR